MRERHNKRKKLGWGGEKKMERKGKKKGKEKKKERNKTVE